MDPIRNYSYFMSLVNKTTNEKNVINECICCRRLNVIGSFLYRTSRILGYEVYLCDTCMKLCIASRKKCEITRTSKKLNTFEAIISRKNRLPSNMRIIIR
jgi:hypothetical protein